MKKLFLSLVMMLTASIAAWADNVTLQVDDSGTKYVNMPATGTNTLTITDVGFTAFKVYDDGGAEGGYSNDCDGYLILTAPDGYRLQLEGSYSTEDGFDLLSIYDGNSTDANAFLSEVGGTGEVEKITSSGRSLMIHFVSDGSSNYEGFDFTVRVFNPDQAFAITINKATGGSLTSQKATAKFDEVVTLSEKHDNGYLLERVSIVDSNGLPIDITGGTWYHPTTTFTMPAAAVTVTPTFIKASTAEDGLFVNMPKTGTLATELSTGVTTFKVYDDGGAEENYSNDCDGYLILTAPEGFRLQLRGTFKAEDNYDFVSIYDGTTTEDPALLSPVSGTDNPPVKVTSSGRSLLVHFLTDSGSNYEGLDFTVRVFNPSETFPITINKAEGGALACQKTAAAYDENVTITETHDKDYVLKSVSVVDAYGNEVNIDGGTWYNVVTSFLMPPSAVTVTPTFMKAATAEDGLFVNMPKTGTLATNISTGVRTFKVYDDGGAEENYSNDCDGYLILTAPEGFRLQLRGTFKAEDNYDFVSIYDGTTTEDPALLSPVSGTDNPPVKVTSSGRSLLVHFLTDSGSNYEGLDFTVHVFDTNQQNPITISSVAGGAMASSKATATFDEKITLTETHNKGYVLQKVQAVDAYGNDVSIEGGVWYYPEATFLMPAAGVTVTPAFMKATTVEDGLSINMPVTGRLNTNISTGVKSFKVYDDGGADNDYSGYCDGILVLTAPVGYRVQLTGTADTEGSYDYLSIFDGTTTEGTALFPENSGENMNIGELISSGRSMTIRFRSDHGSNFAGLNFTATLVPIKYTLAFDKNNETATGTMETVTLTYDEPKALPAVGYSRTAYDFAGWAMAANDTVFYVDKAEVVNLASEEGAKVTIYGKWTPTVYTITYDLAQGKLAEGEANPDKYTIETATFTLKNPTRRGYTFAGWTGTDLSEPTKEVTVDKGHYGNREYKATWTVNVYTLTYDLAGGKLPEGKENPKEYTVESSDITLVNPVREGYEFAGWTGTDIKTDTMTVTIKAGSIGNRSYKATWTPVTYAISYDLAGGSLPEGKENPAEYTIESEVKLVAPVREGYEFAGWTGTGLDEPTMEVVIAKGSMGDRTYTATWTLVAYTLTYDLDGGSLLEGKDNPAEYTIESDDITLVNPERENHTFLGWTGTGLEEPTMEVTIAKGSTGNREFTATWKANLQPGDVNGDGAVGIGDIVAVTNVMAGIEQDGAVRARADVNHDGEVGIGDIVAITNIMAGL